MATESILSELQPRAARAASTDDDGGLPPKPLVRPPSRAKSNARQRLAESLAQRHTHDEASAMAVARAVVDRRGRASRSIRRSMSGRPAAPCTWSTLTSGRRP